MRWDESLDQEFVSAANWISDPVTRRSGGNVDRYKLPSDRKARMSLSGSERNRLFVKGGDGSFVDVSGSSGIDSADDGRTIALLDYDRDGLEEFLLTNTNNHTLRLFRNRLGDLGPANNFLAIRFVGGNRAGGTSSTFSNRDGVGARVTVTTDTGRIVRELRCGEGLAAQNSRTLLVGLGAATVAPTIEVEWPSGRTSRVAEVEARSLITFHEDPSTAGDGSGVAIEPYRKVEVPRAPAPRPRPRFPFRPAVPPTDVIVFTAMATWCPSCRGHLVDFERIRDAFGGAVQSYAIPIDVEDDAAKLAVYVESHEPAYTLLPPSAERGKVFVEIAQRLLGGAELPFSVVVSAQGEIVDAMRGVPTISGLKKVRSEAGEAPPTTR